MKHLLPLTLVAVLLSGCPDPKVPKVPPKAPEPKAAVSPLQSPPEAPPRDPGLYRITV